MVADSDIVDILCIYVWDTWILQILCFIMKINNFRGDATDVSAKKNYCCRMIDAGEMHASLDEAAGMVRFQESEENSTPALLAALNGKMAAMIKMQTRLQAASRDVALDLKYVKASVHLEKSPSQRRPSSAQLESLVQLL